VGLLRNGYIPASPYIHTCTGRQENRQTAKKARAMR
jgi:hypothetical protein